jgi:hypothetical protein
MQKITQHDDPVITTRWEWWHYEIEPALSRLPSIAVMQRANKADQISRLWQGITDSLH